MLLGGESGGLGSLGGSNTVTPAFSFHVGRTTAYRVTESGDITANQVTIFRVRDGALRLDRVLTPSLSLVIAR